MGGCVSSNSQSTCTSRRNGGSGSSSCFGMGKQKRKRSKRTFADHVTSMQDLSSIPNRMFTNGKGQTSCIFTQQGRKGINQDAMIVWENFMADDVTFCGIFDGHGPHGHLVARRVRDALPLKLISFLNQIMQVRSGATCSNENLNSDGGEADKDLCEENTAELWQEAFLKSYKAMDKELKSHPNLDCFCSGSTGVTIVKQGSNLFMGNIGDSRAIMGSKGTDDSLIAIQLTVDLKPDLPNEPEVHRVWLPFDDAPGLAMARAFGDFCLKEYGVISVPEFTHRTLTEKDHYIILASDGVWDVLSNEEVVEIVSSAPARSLAARILVESAAREWKLKYPTSKMDDCAVVCLFLHGKMNTESDYDEQAISFQSFETIPSNHSGPAMESEDGQDSEPCLQRNFTIRTSGENDSYRKLPAEVAGNLEASACEDQSWCGLEGVT